jgi:DNA-directed RNA polymerase subunit RPC12/RpoP
MDGENSEKFLCPKCGEQELEDLGWGIKCQNCGYAMPRPRGGIRTWLKRNSKYIPSLVGLIIYSTPILAFFLMGWVICIYILYDAYHTLCSYPNANFIFEIVAPIILYMLLSLAILDLGSLVARQYLDKIKFKFFYCIPIPIGTVGGGSREEDREYLSKLIVIAVVLILMHIFHKILTCPDHDIELPLVILITGCLFGAAAILMAVGVWKLFDSKGDQP